MANEIRTRILNVAGEAPSSLSEGELTVNLGDTPPTLFVGISGSVERVGPVVVEAGAPVGPRDGTLWLNSTDWSVQYYADGQWHSFSPTWAVEADVIAGTGADHAVSSELLQDVALNAPRVQTFPLVGEYQFGLSQDPGGQYALNDVQGYVILIQGPAAATKDQLWQVEYDLTGWYAAPPSNNLIVTFNVSTGDTHEQILTKFANAFNAAISVLQGSSDNNLSVFDDNTPAGALGNPAIAPAPWSSWYLYGGMCANVNCSGAFFTGLASITTTELPLSTPVLSVDYLVRLAANGKIHPDFVVSAINVFSSTANYAQNDMVVHNGTIYAAKAAVTPGPWNLNQWTTVAPTDSLQGITTDTTLLVTPTGNDLTGDGSVAQPFKTMGGALAWLALKHIDSDVTVTIDGTAMPFPETYTMVSPHMLTVPFNSLVNQASGINTADYKQQGVKVTGDNNKIYLATGDTAAASWIEITGIPLDPEDCTATESFTLAINQPAGSRPNLTLTFSPATTYDIDWGDGTTDTGILSGAVASHTYAAQYVGDVTITHLKCHDLIEMLSTGGASHWNFQLHDLPDTLEKLVTKNTGSTITGSLNNLPRSLKYIDLDYAVHTIITGSLAHLPPHMEYLDLRKCVDSSISGELADLPPDMQHVNLGNTKSSVTGNLTDLPRHLTYLQLDSSSCEVKGDVNTLLPGITDIILNNTSSVITGNTAALPRTLINFYIQSCPNSNIVGTIANLPPNLRAFNIGSTASVVTGTLADIPRTVQDFSAYETDSAITGAVADMPSVLKIFGCLNTPNMNITGAIADLPGVMTQFNIGGSVATPSVITGAIADIPANLLILQLENTNSVITGDLADLTVKIQGISLSGTQSTITPGAGAISSTKLKTVYFQDIKAPGVMDSAAVDAILVKFSTFTGWASGAQLYLDGGTNGAPSATGQAAIPTIQGRGVTVRTN